MPDLLYETVQTFGHSSHLYHPIIDISLVSIPGQGVVLVHHITAKVLEVQPQTGHQLVDDIAQECHCQVERDHPQSSSKNKYQLIKDSSIQIKDDYEKKTCLTSVSQ